MARGSAELERISGVQQLHPEGREQTVVRNAGAVGMQQEFGDHRPQHAVESDGR